MGLGSSSRALLQGLCPAVCPGSCLSLLLCSPAVPAWCRGILGDNWKKTLAPIWVEMRTQRWVLQQQGWKCPEGSTVLTALPSAFICCWPSRAMQSVRVCSGAGRRWDVQNLTALLTGAECLPAPPGMAEVVVRVLLACCGPSLVLTSTSTQPGGAAAGAAHAKSTALCPRRVTAPH